MKIIESWIWTGAKVALIVAGLGTIVIGLKHFADQTDRESQAEIDDWVNQRVADALSRKLDQPVQAVRNALQNPARSSLTERIEQLVQSVTLTFRKLSSSTVQIKLDLLYRNDAVFSTEIEKEWDELPATVRQEFLQTGNQTVRRIWDLFPSQLELN